MATARFSQTATGLVAQFGKAAHQAIGLYREGGERLATASADRWDAAFAQAGPQLSAETRRNAARARKAFGSAYSRGLGMSADGATAVVDTVVGLAIVGIDKACARQPGRGAA